MTRRRSSAAGPADELALDLFGAPDAPAVPPVRAAAAAPGPVAAAERRARRERAPAHAAREPSPDDIAYAGFDAIPGATAASAVNVATLTSTAKDLVEGAFLPLWVRGEVCDFKAHRNGHWYFSLRDHAAQIRCVVWARDQRGIPAPPDEGMQVTVLAQVTVYAARGDLQLSVKAMEAAGDGLWRKALEQAQLRLEAEGLLAPERKRPLPRYPRRVAVVTSPSGAALHDIVSVARRRWPAVELVLVPARVQGEGATHELVAAIERVGRWGLADVVIVGRGGGAREDLWAFNDEAVARALALCPIPTISAVGHEVDVTLCDLVADLRAATPSAAAEAAVPVRAEAIAAVARLAGHLHASARARLDRAADDRRALARLLADRAARAVERRQAAVRELAARLEVLSPLGTLARGYAVARDGAGRTLGSVARFAAGDPFTLLLRDGRVSATAREVHPDGPGAAPSSTGTAP